MHVSLDEVRSEMGKTKKTKATRHRSPPKEVRSRIARIDEDVILRARVLAAEDKVSLAQYLSEVLRPIVDSRFQRLTAKLGRQGR